MAAESIFYLIRAMKASDIETIAHRYCFPWSTYEKSLKLWQSYFLEQEKGIRTAAVIVEQGEIIGYGSLLRKSDYPHFSGIPEINNLWIDEPHRGHGWATKLIRWLEDLARKEGYTRIGLGVGLYADYGPAQRLYCRLGYSPDGHGITYKNRPALAGESYPLDDDLLLWLTKKL